MALQCVLSSMHSLGPRPRQWYRDYSQSADWIEAVGTHTFRDHRMIDCQIDEFLCLNLLFVTVINITTKCSLGRKGFILLHFQVSAHYWGKPGRQGPGAESMENACWPVPSSLCGCRPQMQCDQVISGFLSCDQKLLRKLTHWDSMHPQRCLAHFGCRDSCQ